MTARHRKEPVRTGSAIRRAVMTSVLSAVALTSVTITAAAVTLTNATPHAEPPAAVAPETTSTAPTRADLPLAPPVEIEELPVGIPDIVLVSADGPQLDQVPSAALAAYQRAAGVLAGADKQCHLEWSLVAAVGQVVTGHGTSGDGQLNENGLLRPKLAGKPLQGRDGTRIPDSDAGRLDGDARFDRPVGPMQLSPATWAVVGVDSDGDGKRNPHDIDDAALAVSVLLCSGNDDLRKRAGRVAAVRRINDDRSFIETVLAVDRAYRYQMTAANDVDPFVVPTDVPTDLPIDARSQAPTDPSTDLPTAPTPDPSATATDPVTWVPPTADGDAAAQGPDRRPRAVLPDTPDERSRRIPRTRRPPSPPTVRPTVRPTSDRGRSDRPGSDRPHPSPRLPPPTWRPTTSPAAEPS